MPDSLRVSEADVNALGFWGKFDRVGQQIDDNLFETWASADTTMALFPRQAEWTALALPIVPLNSLSASCDQVDLVLIVGWSLSCCIRLKSRRSSTKTCDAVPGGAPT